MGPATLDDALTQLSGQCYGTAICGCDSPTGTVLVVASHWDEHAEESAEHWFYDTSGTLVASLGTNQSAGTPPEHCEDRTVVPSEACGFLPLE